MPLTKAPRRSVKTEKKAVVVAPGPFPGAWPGGWSIGEEELANVAEVIRAQSPFRHYGPNVVGMARKFEKAFAAKMGTRFALGVTSGTGALSVGLAALEVGPEDEVIMPSYPWISCPAAVVLAGAIPVLAEIDDTLNLDPRDIEQRISPRTKAIMVVHTSGVAADMAPIMEVARKRGVKVIEDCAQSCGARYQDKLVGTIGEVGTYSLQMNKIITAGEGGAVVTSDAAIYERAVRYHDLGMVRPQFEIEATGKAFFGANCRMSELTGAVAFAQLKKLHSIIARMRKAKRAIVQGIADLPGITFRRMPDPAGDAAATVCFFLPDLAAADRLAGALSAASVPCGKPYGGKTLHENWPDHFAGWLAGRQARGARPLAQDYKPGMCPRSEALLKRLFAVSITPNLTASHVDRVVGGIRQAWKAV